MRVLLLGPTGQLGGELQRAAPPRHELMVVPEAELDLRDAAAVQRLLQGVRPALVLNAAAYTDVDGAEAQPELAHAINATAVRTLAGAVAAVAGRLIHVSTDYVFDGQQGSPYAPDAPTAPINVYGASKRDGERHALELLGERAVVVRTAWLYAAGGRNFVQTMLRLLRERPRVEVVDDQLGTPTWARSLAQALWQLAERPDLQGVQHFTDAGTASWYDLAVAVREEGQALGLLAQPGAVLPIPSSAMPRPARRPACSVLDKHATWSALGAAPPHWREALRQMLCEVRDGG
ncbi:MAG: dTDP-4-dehydrorhamnose reductase [Proteobacteria bacterium]|nr:dTDP-4-dehydrorhamnose reductase [Pseudomonadota bacterium]